MVDVPTVEELNEIVVGLDARITILEGQGSVNVPQDVKDALSKIVEWVNK